ncbi:hypothetical protein DEU56DRAFT_918850 [Suillus clintonianus]|uniref:uncharacterized protein n=1 Tax=Suillus clintonianus TaxID=1904413 RepID=UPI001B866ADC|nr:uncharacterized protein DEU56DRAFT_918850 [Suillus clintonianus]KAG2118455.1 hypothetical protein DEU56DRAFT_918850 [Suillus clintonianus]
MAPFLFDSLADSPPPSRAASPVVASPAQEPEPIETEADVLRRKWTALREVLDTLVRVMPDDKEELMEDQETWMRSWNGFMTRVMAAGDTARHLQIELDLDDEEHVLMTAGRKAYKNFEGAIRLIKEKAAAQAEEVVTARPPAAQKKKMEVLVPSSKKAGVQTDMGAPLPTGRMTGRAPLGEKCERCTKLGRECDGSPGVRCDTCAKAHQQCSFKRGAARAPPKRRVQKAAPASSRAPTAESGPRTASSRQEVMELDSGNELGLESEEMSVPEPVPAPGLSALPARPTRAINPILSGPKKRRVEESLDRYEEGGELERLRSENARLRELLRRVGERSRIQQAEMAAQSSRLYSMSREWKEDEELAEFL